MTFWDEALPYARQVHAAMPEMFVSFVLAQWADETGYGGYDWAVAHNPGNVGSFDGQPVNTFPTLEAGVAAYMQTLKNGYYNGVLAAKDWQAQCYAMGQSPWASGHYEAGGPPPGQDLVKIVQNNDLTQYDSAPIPPLPVPIKEETMSLATLPNGEIVISAVGAGNRADHLLVFTLNPTNPTTPQFNVIDVTAGIGTPNPYTVASA